MNEIFDILMYIKSNDEISQRDIANKFRFSIGKVNNLISKMRSDCLIDSNSEYKITDKGQRLIEDNKVDNAIIMAAGFGSRFVPITYDTPKGLIEVNGERLVERLIKQLQETGIYDITIVVGYLKEKFEYLKDKYNVKLIFNPDYSVKNNISSLYYAKSELKNTYILTSDIYLKDNLFSKYEQYSYYSSVFESEETSEWCVDLSKSNLITGVNSEGGSNSWVMFGPTFFKQDFSDTLIDLISENYDNPRCAQWYWEDVYMRNLNKLDMYVKKYSNDAILEFESIEDLKKYDPNYIFNANSDIIDTISHVFNVTHDQITDIKNLKEGMTNDSFIFSVNDAKYVFRVSGKGTDLLINRVEEAAVYEAISDIHISDDITHLDLEKGYKISKYIPNSRTLDAHNELEVEEAMSLLRRLHNSNLVVAHSFDIRERIEFYIKICTDSKAVLFEDFKFVHEDILKVLDRLDSHQRPKTLCHIDAVPVNFLLSDNGFTLLDWEYAGMADPIIDIAMYIVYNGDNRDYADKLLEVYLQRKPTKVELEVLYSYIASAGFLWSLWAQFKLVQGNDFGTYAMEQYQYGREFSRLVLNNGGN